MVPRRNLAIAAAAILAAVGCAIIAAMSLFAAIASLPADQVIERLRRGDSVSDEQVAQAAAASLRAGLIFERGRYFSNAALALAKLDASKGARPKEAPPLAAVVEQALTAAPAAPHNWARRAAIQLAANDLVGARGSIETSLLLGRYVPGLTVPRLRTMLELMKRSSSIDMESEFAEQVRIAAQTEPFQLAQFADGGAAEGRVQRILARDFALYDPYIRNLQGIRDERARTGKGVK